MEMADTSFSIIELIKDDQYIFKSFRSSISTPYEHASS